MNILKKNRTYNAAEKALIILLGALLMGFLWRIRGTSGWGSSWGLLNAGFLFTMFICLIKGDNNRLDLKGVGVISLAFMLTTPAWGTIIDQITGVLFTAEELAEIPALAGNDIYCSIPSAIFLMLCLGFGLASIFGILLGSVYGEKKWKIKDYIIIVALFFIIEAITKATVSHWILNAIQPDAVSVFEEGLKLEGITESAYQAYLSNFDNASWAKKIIGGRNYFASIDTISLAINSVICILATRFIIKDKYAAKAGLTVCSAFAVGITVSDLFFYFFCGGYHQQGAVYEGTFISPWSCWEYFTGFIAGGLITAFMLKSSKQAHVQVQISQPKKTDKVLGFILGYILLVGVSVVRPILERMEDSEFFIPAVIASVIAAIILIIFLTKKWGTDCKNADMHTVCSTLLLIFIIYECIVYFFVGDSEHRNFSELAQLHNIITLLSAASLNYVLNRTVIRKDL